MDGHFSYGGEERRGSRRRRKPQDSGPVLPAVRPYKGLQLCLNLASSDHRLRTNPPPPLLASSNYPSAYIIARNEANALRDFALNEEEGAEDRVSFAFLKHRLVISRSKNLTRFITLREVEGGESLFLLEISLSLINKIAV